MIDYGNPFIAISENYDKLFIYHNEERKIKNPY